MAGPDQTAISVSAYKYKCYCEMLKINVKLPEQNMESIIEVYNVCLYLCYLSATLESYGAFTQPCLRVQTKPSTTDLNPQEQQCSMASKRATETMK